MWKAYLTIETKNTIFHRESFSRKDVLKTCLESKEFVKNQRIWERSKWGEYHSPWPKVDYAWVDGSVPKKGSRAAPRPRAKWYRLRGWESWTRGWTTLSRFPPHSRGSPSTPWTFLLLQDRKIHDLKRGSSSSLKLRLLSCSSSITEHNKDLYSMRPPLQHLHQLFSPPLLNIDHSIVTLWKHQFCTSLPFALDSETLVQSLIAFRSINTRFSF